MKSQSKGAPQFSPAEAPLVVRDAEDDGILRRASVELDAIRPWRRAHARIGREGVRRGEGGIQRVALGDAAAVLLKNSRARRQDARVGVG
jgi:hypothetical protein